MVHTDTHIYSVGQSVLSKAVQKLLVNWLVNVSLKALGCDIEVTKPLDVQFP